LFLLVSLFQLLLFVGEATWVKHGGFAVVDPFDCLEDEVHLDN